PTAVNVDLLPNASGTINLGSNTLLYNNAWISTLAAPLTISSLTSVTSGTANPSTTGLIRGAKTDAFKLRNNGNTADLNAISLDTNDALKVGDAAGIETLGPVNAQSSPLAFTVANDGVTGTVHFETTCLTSSGNAIQCPAATTSGAIGITTSAS